MRTVLLYKRQILIAGSILLSIILFPLAAMRKGDYSFKHIDSQKGLSENNVKCITQDQFGFMWFGTKNGLNRYDGSTIRRFDCFDEKSNRGNNNIASLYEDEKSNLWIGTDRGIYIYNPHSDSIRYVSRRSRKGAVATNWVQRITGDKSGNVWALLPDEGIYLYSADKVEHFSITNSDNLKVMFPSDLCVDRKKNVWVVTARAGIFKYDPDIGRFLPINTQSSIDTRNMLFSCVSENDEGQLVMGTADGHLYCYDPSSNIVQPVVFSQAGSVYLRYIECFEDEIWIGTHSGLYVLNRTSEQETVLKENSLDKFSLSDNTIYYIYRDNDGGAWVGTMFGGVNYFSRSKFRFVNYGVNSNLSSRLIIGLTCDIEGKIWIGTENAGVNILDANSSKIKHADFFSPSDKIVLSMWTYGENVYTSFSRSGLFKTDVNNKNSQRIFPMTPEQDRNVYAYLIDSRGNEWIGQGFALYRRNNGEMDFRRIQTTNYDWIYSIFEASDGVIWIGTMGNGIWKYNPANGTFKSYAYDHAAITPNGLKSNSINSIMEDSGGNIWISTDRGGLSRYNKNLDTFTTYGIANGLPDDCVYSVLEDDNGHLWFGTNKGLVRFTPKTCDCQIFTIDDGLPGNQYNYKSAIRASDGRFYFGSINGVVSFIPEHYDNSMILPPVYITELRILSKDMRVANMLFSKEVKLKHDESTFAVTVSSPTYKNLGRISFSYRLLPANEEYILMNDNEISFTNLAPSKYVLEVKVDNGSMSNVHCLKIEILPPWWKSTWAYCSIVLILMLLALLWFFWYRNRKELQMRNREQTFAINKEKELYRSKVNFFTEIAHEIRTPLSLIDLPLEAIEEMEVNNPDIKRYLKVSRQNTQRLLELTGQLLDFEKIDTNKLTLKKENINISVFIKEIADSFEPTISLMGKCLIREFDNRPLMVSIDRDALTKIVSNLLNNALKYGLHTIRLLLIQFVNSFQIKVISDGAKIHDKERERIFHPFYQTQIAEEAKNGVGIGLPLSKSLATLLGGTLELEKNSDNFNIFTLSLPVTELIPNSTPELDIEMENYMFIEEESNQAKSRSDIYNMLLVEDNLNILSFLAEQLRRSFLVETAANGKEAFEKLCNNQFDVIVSDIMMPVMDGFELCSRIKEDINLSHIPIVFITAKDDLESKIKGLQYGAEAYIEKPFSIKYLKQLVNSLLENRCRERNSFFKNPFFSIDNMQINKGDKDFINKVRQVIEEHMSEEEFSVETMCDLLHMSRSSLLRKIKSLFNLSPIELIRLIKLKKAAELIQTGEYRISEVCYMVGITSPSYFSKLFYKQFGIAPKDFEKQFRSKNNPPSIELPENGVKN